MLTYRKTLQDLSTCNYTQENLEKAMEAVRGGTSKKKAAETFKVPRSTLVRNILGRNQGPVGHPTVLSKSEEQLISGTLGVVANWGLKIGLKIDHNLPKKE